MNIEQIKAKAGEMGINPEGKNQMELIHAIQEAEGFYQCFGKGMFVCPNLECCWRESCLGIWGITNFRVGE
uniref:SAP domain-containing protein n=1 Tax=viral metagenome TaxID=1070528 RepID=A0A6M3J7Q9_9ZZZZ